MQVEAPRVFESGLSTIEIKGATVSIEPKRQLGSYVANLGRITGVLIYRDERIGLLMADDEIVDVPCSRAQKLAVAEAIAKAAGFYQAAR